MKSAYIALLLALSLVALATGSMEERDTNYDYVIIGGGGAGAVVAGQLAREGHKVLVLEFGQNTQYDPNVALAQGFFGTYNTQSNNLSPSSDQTYIWPNVVNADSGRYGDKSPPTSGKGLGGGTSVFRMMYIHGGREMYDYSDWPASWNYDSMRPFYQQLNTSIAPNRDSAKPTCSKLFLKSLRYQAEEQYANGGIDYLVNQATKVQGVVHIESPDDGAPQLDYDDLDGQNSVVAFSRFKYFMNKLSNGTYIRKASANTYLGPDCLRADGSGTVKCPRLDVLTNALVTRIIIEKKSGKLTATGVEYYQGGKGKTVKAKSEVILSAGSYQTPAILQRSGYGDAAYLSQLGINVVYNNTRVGKNLRNHFSLLMPIQINGPTSAIAQVLAGSATTPASMGMQGGAFLTFHKNHPNRPTTARSVRKTQFMYVASASNFDKDLAYTYKITRTNETLMFSLDDIRFDPVGSVQIASASPFDFPEITFNTFLLYSDPTGTLQGEAFWKAAAAGTDALISGILNYHIGYRTMLGMNRALAESGINASLSVAYPTQPALATLDQALQTFGDNWWKYLFPSYIITANSTALERQLVAALQTLTDEVRRAAHVDSHQCGTSRIGEVVDDELKVLGVRNLRVVDASIMPRQSGGNTGATALAIGLRGAAQIIADDRRR